MDKKQPIWNNYIYPQFVQSTPIVHCPNVISTKRPSSVISTKRSAWRDLSTTFEMTIKGGRRNDI
ncbi:MAG: hypothetical protein ACI3Z0_05080 [Candidatus Cryptobacteroides sp.]